MVVHCIFFYVDFFYLHDFGQAGVKFGQFQQQLSTALPIV